MKMIETKLDGKELIISDEFLKQSKKLIKLSKKNKREEVGFISGKENSKIILEKICFDDRIYQKSALGYNLLNPFQVYSFLSKIDNDGIKTGGYSIGLSHTHDEKLDNLIENISIYDITACHGIIPKRINVTLFWDDSFIIYNQSAELVKKSIRIYEKNYDERNDKAGNKKEMENILHNYLKKLQTENKFDIKLLQLPN